MAQKDAPLVKRNVRAHMRLIILILSAFITSSCAAAEKLPRVDTVTHIEFKSHELDGLRIDDPKMIGRFLGFYNQFLEGWSIPWYGPPVAKIHFSLFSGNQLAGDFGVSNNFITRTHGNFWSQTVSEERILAFINGSHPALVEMLYPKIPKGKESRELLSHWKEKLKALDVGATKGEIESFIRENAIRVSHRNNGEYNLGYWWNIELTTVNKGQFVNTIVAAQLVLNEDLSLKKKRFFGYKLAKKSPNNSFNSDGKKRRSFLALLFSAG